MFKAAALSPFSQWSPICDCKTLTPIPISFDHTPRYLLFALFLSRCVYSNAVIHTNDYKTFVYIYSIVLFQQLPDMKKASKLQRRLVLCQRVIMKAQRSPPVPVMARVLIQAKKRVKISCVNCKVLLHHYMLVESSLLLSTVDRIMIHSI